MAAFSFIEILFVLGTAATVSAVAVPETLATLDDSRTAAAARYVSTRLQRTRIEAVARNSSSAIRFARLPDHYDFATYVDGNGNGVLTRDIQSGIDRVVHPPDRLGDHFPGVEFGTIANLPAIDASSTPPGTDPIRLGSSDMATFTPTGTATSGTLYILGRRNTIYAIRVFGETGKTRILKFNSATNQWIPASDL